MRGMPTNIALVLCVLGGILSGVLQPALAETPVGGSITVDTTWTLMGSPYVTTTTVTVNAGVTLTIDPGVQVRLSAFHQLVINGTLSAAGTELLPITFTSNQGSPSAGDWVNIQLNGSSTGSVFDHCIIEYAGQGNEAALRTLSVPVTVTNSSFNHLLHRAILVTGEIAPSTIDYNSFSNTGYDAVYFQHYVPGTSIVGNDFQNCNGYPIVGFGNIVNNTGNNNAVEGIVLPQGAIEGVMSASNDFVFLNVGSGFSVASGDTLAIEPGVVIKSTSGITVSGTMTMQGETAHPIVFTSIHDDTYGGDTWHNGSGTQPWPGDWVGITLASTSVDSDLNHCIVRYAGAYGMNIAVLFEAIPAIVTNSTIEHCGSYGIYSSGTLASVIRNTIISNVGSSGITLTTFHPDTVIEDCQISNCASYPIRGFGEIVNNTGSGNAIDGILIPNTNVSGTIDPSNSFVFVTQGFSVAADDTLELLPDAVIKMENGASVSVSGVLSTSGTTGHPVVFTSWKDDTAGGDTYHDGTSTSPAAGDWSYLSFGGSQPNTLNSCTVRYAGAYGNTAVVLACPQADMQNCVIEYCANNAVQLALVNPGNISNNTIAHIGGSGLFISGYLSDTLIQNNDIHHCGSYPIRGFGNLSGNDLHDNAIDAILLPNTDIDGTLPADHVYAAQGFHINIGDTMIIEPGVVVKMESGSIQVDGTMSIAGTSSDPIVFTSWKDDDYAGDTYHDGSATTPASGDWNTLSYGSGGVGSIDYGIFRYNGAFGNPSVLLGNVAPSFQHSIIEYSGGPGLLVSTFSPCTISNNQIAYTIGAGIDVTVFYPLNIISGNQIHQCGSYPIRGFGTVENNAGAGNAIDAILLPQTSISGNLSATNDFAFASTGFAIDSGSSLTIDPGIVLKMQSGAITNLGNLSAIGNPSAPISITSWKDDSIGGDTWNDGNATTPAPGDWAYVLSDSSSEESEFRSVRIRYGGASGNPMVMNYGHSMPMSDCVFDHSAAKGLDQILSEEIRIENTLVANCSGAGIALNTTADVWMQNVASVNNGGNGIESTIATLVNITVANNGGYALNLTGSPIILNAILWGNVLGVSSGTGSITVAYSDVQGGWSGAGYSNIDLDPHFVSGPDGDYYLDVTARALSPCIDAGSEPADSICMTIVPKCLDEFTTRIDEIPDVGIVDIGYHYPTLLNPPTPTSTATATPTRTPTQTPSRTPPPTPSRTPTPTSTPVPPTATPTRTPTLTPSPTSTPSPTRSPTPSMTPTSQPTATAEPSHTPTVLPTETPACGELGVELWMPAHFFREGDPCGCSVFLCNPSDETYSDVPLFVLLDVYGSYFFAPGYTSFDRYVIDLHQGREEMVILPVFNWPQISGSADGILWYAAMTNAGMSELFGGMDSWEFGWGQ